jgi:protein TIF31
VDVADPSQSNAGVVLQAVNENALSLTLLSQAQRHCAELFGAQHIQTGQALHQLTQAHFLAGDIPKALETSKAALEIFEARLGKENGQTMEVAKNVELLTAVVENVEKQKQATQQAKERQLERLRAAQARVASTTRRKLGTNSPTLGTATASASAGPSSAAAVDDAAQQAAAVQEGSRIGERGHLDVDELVKFIQGQGQQPVKRAKNALRGKRRTGAKR